MIIKKLTTNIYKLSTAFFFSLPLFIGNANAGDYAAVMEYYVTRITPMINKCLNGDDSSCNTVLFPCDDAKRALEWSDYTLQDFYRVSFEEGKMHIVAEYDLLLKRCRIADEIVNSY